MKRWGACSLSAVQCSAASDDDDDDVGVVVRELADTCRDSVGWERWDHTAPRCTVPHRSTAHSTVEGPHVVKTSA